MSEAFARIVERVEAIEVEDNFRRQDLKSIRQELAALHELFIKCSECKADWRQDTPK